MVEKQGVVTLILPVEALTIGIKLSDQGARKSGDQAQ